MCLGSHSGNFDLSASVNRQGCSYSHCSHRNISCCHLDFTLFGLSSFMPFYLLIFLFILIYLVKPHFIQYIFKFNRKLATFSKFIFLNFKICNIRGFGVLDKWNEIVFADN